MELKEFIQVGLDRVKQANFRATDGLSYSEMMWQPKPDANSIGLILFHMARSEDRYVQATIQGKPQVWESEKWYERLSRPASDIGSGYTAEQVAAFVVPESKDLLAYAEAVRARTLEVLRDLPLNSFDRVVKTPRGDFTIGVLLTQVLVHPAQHVGEISYLRGLQRGLNK